jgi:hypothetical protein
MQALVRELILREFHSANAVKVFSLRDILNEVEAPEIKTHN